ncbi:MAG: hypothetical protein Q8Q09_21995 [Deltaproteobacteria bacterium]|nr:hypothetical protein [Deltaproteobacteria bacterium]
MTKDIFRSLLPLAAIPLVGCVLPHAIIRGDQDVMVLDETAMDTLDGADAIDEPAVVDAGLDVRDELPPVDDVPGDTGLDVLPEASRDVLVADAPCTPGTAQCGARCVDLSADSNHCGVCGVVCGAGRACSSGRCECAGTTVECSGACVDVATNVSHCGMCDKPCDPTGVPGASVVCTGGMCGVRCPDGATRVGATCVVAPLSASATCPGQMLTLLAAQSVVVNGTLAGTTDALRSSGDCDLRGGERVFQFTAPAAGTVTLELTSFAAVGFYVRRAVCTSGTQAICRASDSPANYRIGAFSVVAGEQLFVVVDREASATTMLDFTLRIVHEAGCGTTVREGAQCADGNSVPGDGCDANCRIESGTLAERCPGASDGVLRSNDRVVRMQSDGRALAMRTYQCTPDGMSTTAIGAGSLRERVISVETSAGAPFRAEVIRRSSYSAANRGDYLLTEWQSCAMPPAVNRCVDLRDSQGERIDSSTVASGAAARRSIGIGDRGDTTYEVVVTPARCGDGVLGPAEECDDGNGTAGDGCTACMVDPACVLTETTDSTDASPLVWPSACATLRINGTLSPGIAGADTSDLLVFDAFGGDVVRWATWRGTPGNCPANYDNIVHVLAPGAAAFPAVFSCSTTGSVGCFDDGATWCSDATFLVPTTSPNHRLRIAKYNNSGTGTEAYTMVFTRVRN